MKTSKFCFQRLGINPPLTLVRGAPLGAALRSFVAPRGVEPKPRLRRGTVRVVVGSFFSIFLLAFSKPFSHLGLHNDITKTSVVLECIHGYRAFMETAGRIGGLEKIQTTGNNLNETHVKTYSVNCSNKKICKKIC